MNKEQLEKDIAEMKARIASMETELAKPKSKVFVPKAGHEYWYVSSYGVGYATQWASDNLDNLRLACGNCYETKEAAQKATDKQFATVRVLNKLRELEGDWVADWNDSTQEKCTIYFNHVGEKFCVDWYKCQHAPKKWYTSKKASNWVIDNMDADLRLMFEVE